MIERITFAGKNFKDFQTFVDGSLTFSKPAKDVEFFSVAGKNGDLSISNNRFENIEIKIPCFIKRDFKVNFSGLMDFLSSTEGYQRLETYEEPDMYRLAQFVSAIEPTTGSFMHYGSFELVFNCKPQVFYKEGDLPIKLRRLNSLRNPSLKVAKPLFLVTGNGEIRINGNIVAISGVSDNDKTYIDIDIEDAYYGSINRNGNMTITNDFPTLNVGDISIENTFSEAIMYARWWRL